jgi:ribonuclease III
MDAQRFVRELLGHEPRDPALFAAALTHRSVPGPNNERLEFLGDAVLNLVISRTLYEAFPRASEGDLSRLRSRVVSSEPLGKVATELRHLGEVLRLGPGVLKSGGYRRESILGDALEALIGAVFLDGGFGPAEQLIQRLFAPVIAALPAPDALKDAKTRLQEYLQSRGLPLPEYILERTKGDPHSRTFRVRCEVTQLGLTTQGSGSSRRKAEQEAAERLLLEIGKGAHNGASHSEQRPPDATPR